MDYSTIPLEEIIISSDSFFFWDLSSWYKFQQNSSSNHLAKSLHPPEQLGALWEKNAGKSVKEQHTEPLVVGQQKQFWDIFLNKIAPKSFLLSSELDLLRTWPTEQKSFSAF